MGSLDRRQTVGVPELRALRKLQRDDPASAYVFMTNRDAPARGRRIDEHEDIDPVPADPERDVAIRTRFLLPLVPLSKSCTPSNQHSAHFGTGD